MTIPDYVAQQAAANYWVLVHISFPLILLGLVVYGVIRYIYEKYYDE